MPTKIYYHCRSLPRLPRPACSSISCNRTMAVAIYQPPSTTITTYHLTLHGNHHYRFHGAGTTTTTPSIAIAIHHRRQQTSLQHGGNLSAPIALQQPSLIDYQHTAAIYHPPIANNMRHHHKIATKHGRQPWPPSRRRSLSTLPTPGDQVGHPSTHFHKQAPFPLSHRNTYPTQQLRLWRTAACALT